MDSNLDPATAAVEQSLWQENLFHLSGRHMLAAVLGNFFSAGCDADDRVSSYPIGAEENFHALFDIIRADPLRNGVVDTVVRFHLNHAATHPFACRVCSRSRAGAQAFSRDEIDQVVDMDHIAGSEDAIH